jgi:hypothetical protein
MAEDMIRVYHSSSYRTGICAGSVVLILADATPFLCSNLVRKRMVVVDLCSRKCCQAPLSEGVVLVSLFKTGYRVWEVGH